MVYVVPIVYRARKNFTARGTDYVVGQTLTSAEAKGLGRLGVLVSGGYLLAQPDTSARRGHEHLGPQPTYIAPGAFPDDTKTAGVLLYDQNTAAPNARVTLDADFPGPTIWSFGDGTADEQGDNHTVHYFAVAGTYEVRADSSTHTASASVPVSDIMEDAQAQEESEKKAAPRKRKAKTDTVVSTGQEEPAS